MLTVLNLLFNAVRDHPGKEDVMATKVTKLKVMSYNVLCFNRINKQPEMQKQIMDTYNAHLIAMQELSTSGKINAVGKAALADYPHQYLSEHKAFLGFASKYALQDVMARDYSNQDPEDMARYGQTRAYHMATLELGGKNITIFNTHLSFHTPEVKYAQMRELFKKAQKHEYVVILGDFNCFMEAANDKEYRNMYKRFADAGYHLANCVDTITKTWTDKTNPKNLRQFTWPTDNIIVSPNITISKVYYNRTKLQHPNGWPMDHIPVVAMLHIH